DRLDNDRNFHGLSSLALSGPLILHALGHHFQEERIRRDDNSTPTRTLPCSAVCGCRCGRASCTVTTTPAAPTRRFCTARRRSCTGWCGALTWTRITLGSLQDCANPYGSEPGSWPDAKPVGPCKFRLEFLHRHENHCSNKPANQGREGGNRENF